MKPAKTRVKTVREMEMDAAAARPQQGNLLRAPAGEAVRMLARRGLRPQLAKLDLPFPRDLEQEDLERLLGLLGHYAFRLFLRGAIQQREGFAPDEATRYVDGQKAAGFASDLVDLGIAVHEPNGRYRLTSSATSFGPTLEWYLAHELERRLAFDVAAGVKFHARGVGGDLDLVAAAEGKLVYAEVKSSPPKHLSEDEVRACFDRIHLVRPDITLFVMDTALRLGDKVVPMLHAEMRRRGGEGSPAPRRLRGELWMMGPQFYGINSKPDLVRNVALAIAHGLTALAPPPPWTAS